MPTLLFIPKVKQAMRTYLSVIGLVVALSQSDAVVAQPAGVMPSARQQYESVVQSAYERDVSQSIDGLEKTKRERATAARLLRTAEHWKLEFLARKAGNALLTGVPNDADEDQKSAKLKRLHQQIRELHKKRDEFAQKAKAAVGEKEKRHIEELGERLEKAEQEIKEQIRKMTEHRNDEEWSPERREDEEQFNDAVLHDLRIKLDMTLDQLGENHPTVVALRRKIELIVANQERREREAQEHPEHEDRRHEEEREHEIHEAHRRMEALREAAERLHHGGVHEIAERLQQEAEEIEQHLHRHHEEDPAREIMEQIHGLREELHELHEKVDHILEFIEGVRDEDEEEEDEREEEARVVPENRVFRGQKLFNVELIKYEPSEIGNRFGAEMLFEIGI